LYVSGISLNGKTWDKNYITHEDLLKGGTLGFTMTSQPDKSRGTGKESWPYSMSRE
jgi:putative alpha-1,2-mannosidase